MKDLKQKEETKVITFILRIRKRRAPQKLIIK